MLRRRTKCVGMPISARRSIRYSLMRLLRTPLPVMVPLLLRVEGGGVVLEILDERAGLRSFEQDLGLAFVDLFTSRHGRASRVRS